MSASASAAARARDADDLVAVVADLAGAAAYPDERAQVEAVQALLADASVPPAQRRAHAHGALAAAARDLLARFWHIEPGPATLAVLHRLAGSPGPVDVLGAMLTAGCGTSALALAPGRRLWLPTWLAQRAGQRAGAALPISARRWALPPRWPVPSEQVLVSLGDGYDRFARWYLPHAPLAGDLALADPAPPPSWRAMPTHALAIDALRTLVALDGREALRQLLALDRAEPLVGVAQVIGDAARACARLQAARGEAWTGAIGGDVQLGLTTRSVVLLPGWLSACLQHLGAWCAGAPSSASAPAESALVVAAGGSVVPGADGDLHVLPEAAGQVLRALPLDWSRVPRLDDA